ncbi:DUF2846 domain-containing protein [Pseudoxanthomonas winnipegensis]|nr:DUF2846 domain-containing protein [Pseudoxanthomonas winnipegensis]
MRLGCAWSASQKRGKHMKRVVSAVLAMASLCVAGCATYNVGGASASAQLKKFEPVPGKSSLYVCREKALLVARGVKTVVLVDNEPIGALKANSFVHTDLAPGKHGVLLRHDGINAGAGGFMTIDTKPDEVRFLWVGVTGHGWGVLTVDNFDDEAKARQCVLGAEYSVP